MDRAKAEDWAMVEARDLLGRLADLDEEDAVKAIAQALREAAHNPLLEEWLNSGDGTYRP